MTKEQIILEELKGMLIIPTSVYKADGGLGMESYHLANEKVAYVDLEKLAKFLAKRLEIKPDKLISEK